ncbi:unnamed protein product [Mytilus coruscus]|uniref:YqaJ viral recombinase domain-containing protein n=1 Tax=Mytilus coruscus TaxID=42192 RepID=A0A6J8A8V8_MYTCO|nr:unnamed protein product [Mytilus coruscus]
MLQYCGTFNTLNYEPSEDFNVLSTETVTTTEGKVLPLSLPEAAENCHDYNELLGKLRYTDAQREKILKETRGQSENTEWLNQRKGRITCSRMHSIFTKSQTLKKNNAVNTESLVSEILGYKEKTSNILALKYGMIMEPVARRKYNSILLQRKHQNLKVEETGLYIDTKQGYLVSSPDGMQTCLEIDEVENNCESDYSIECDKCGRWFHWGCIGYDGMVNMDKWYCDDSEANEENSI